MPEERGYMLEECGDMLKEGGYLSEEHGCMPEERFESMVVCRRSSFKCQRIVIVCRWSQVICQRSAFIGCNDSSGHYDLAQALRLDQNWI